MASDAVAAAHRGGDPEADLEAQVAPREQESAAADAGERTPASAPTRADVISVESVAVENVAGPAEEGPPAGDNIPELHVFDIQGELLYSARPSCNGRDTVGDLQTALSEALAITVVDQQLLLGERAVATEEFLVALAKESAAAAAGPPGSSGGLTLVWRDSGCQVVARMGNFRRAGVVQTAWQFQEITRIVLSEVPLSATLSELVGLVAAQLIKLDTYELQGMHLQNNEEFMNNVRAAVQEHNLDFLMRHVRLFINEKECSHATFASALPWSFFHLVWQSELDRRYVANLGVKRKVSTVDEECTFVKVVLTDFEERVPLEPPPPTGTCSIS